MKEPRESYQATAPGRVNLLGEWIDFNGGTVLPMALPQTITVELRSNGEAEDQIFSTQFAEKAIFAIDAPATGHWCDHIRGALQYARQHGWLNGGQDVNIKSQIPVGAGLSSSAATIVATLKSASSATHSIDRVELALAAQAIENKFLNVPCGIMDQMAVAVGQPGEVLALNTIDLSYERLPLPLDWVVTVIDSGFSRALVDGKYRERRDECFAASRILRTENLCHAQESELRALPATLANRARHAIGENQRTRTAIEYLRSGDRCRFGELMWESHKSLRDNMEVSTPAIDQMVVDVLELGADGARVTGAGFGGCIVCLCSKSVSSALQKNLKSRHADLEIVSTIATLADL